MLLARRGIFFANLISIFFFFFFFVNTWIIIFASYVGGLIGTSLIAFITWHCCVLLLDVKRSIETSSLSPVDSLALQNSVNLDEDQEGNLLLLDAEEREESGHGSFGGVAKEVFGNWGLVIVNVLLGFTQLGFCVGYLIFISSNLLSLAALNPSQVLYSWPHLVAVLIATSVGFMLSLIPSLRTLGWISSASIVCLAVSLLGIAGYSFRFHNAPSAALFIPEGAPIFIGLVTGAFEGIGTVIPVRDSMAGGSPLTRRYEKILLPVMVLVALVLSLFGLAGYLSFGDSTNPVITLNLHPGPVSSAVQVLVMLSVFGTFPLQLRPVVDLCSPRSLSESLSSSKRWLGIIAIRASLCLLVGAIAYGVPFFGLISALVGSVGSSFLMFVFPSLASIRQGYRTQPYLLIVKNAALVAFGTLIAVFGGISAVKNIISALTYGYQA